MPMTVYAQAESQAQPAVASFELGHAEPAVVESVPEMVVLHPGMNTVQRTHSLHSFAYFDETKQGGRFVFADEVALSIKNLYLRTLFEKPGFRELTQQLYAKMDVDQSGQLSAVEARVGLTLIFNPPGFQVHLPWCAVRFVLSCALADASLRLL
jgi:hypothetical protein